MSFMDVRTFRFLSKFKPFRKCVKDDCDFEGSYSTIWIHYLYTGHGVTHNMADMVPQAKCPQCGEWVDDLDGFGVLSHDKCGYCEHPSIDGDVCGICGKTVEE